MKKTSIALAIVFAASASASAQELDRENLYAGIGVSANSLSGADDAIGYQAFGGYEFDIADLRPWSLAAEVGFFNSGTFDSTRTNPAGDRVSTDENADGLWANTLFSYPASTEWNLLARAGLDFGDDDGPMFGAGAGYAINRELELRGEFVIRDHIDSIQANLVYRF